MTDGTDPTAAGRPERNGRDADSPDPAAGGPDPSVDPFDLPCIELVELITDYLEGALDPELVARVDAHLSVCPPCVVVIEQFRLVSEAAGSIVEDDVDALDPAVRVELAAAFRSARRRP